MVVEQDIIQGKALATAKCTHNSSRNAKAQSMTAFIMLLMLCFCISGCGGGSVKDGIENSYGSAITANQDDGTGDNDGDGSGNVGDDIKMSAFKWLNPEATTNGINSMIFSGDTLYAASDFGTIVRADAPGYELVVQTTDMTGLVQSPSSFHFQGI